MSLVSAIFAEVYQHELLVGSFESEGNGLTVETKRDDLMYESMD